MFSKDQNELLAAPLLRSNVSDRQQGSRKLSFLEGWHVIAEANRIFGFDGWHSQTVDLKCVSESPRTIGAKDGFKGYPGFGVTYIAKVRITVTVDVSQVIREGCGAGHGIDRDLGLAHESALKEAETDARKRALMTLGNQFGLALYDKTQENVVSDEPEPVTRKPPPAGSNVMRSNSPPSASPVAANKGASSPPQVDDAPDIPTASEYSVAWIRKIDEAVDADILVKEWSAEKAMRSKIEWPSESFRVALHSKVADAVQFLRG